MSAILTSGPFNVGEIETLTATFRNAAGALTNPSTVTLRIRKPDGTVSVMEPINPLPGIWTYDLYMDMSGSWEYGWKGSGAVADAEEGRFYVRRSRVLV